MSKCVKFIGTSCFLLIHLLLSLISLYHSDVQRLIDSHPGQDSHPVWLHNNETSLLIYFSKSALKPTLEFPMKVLPESMIVMMLVFFYKKTHLQTICADLVGWL